MAGSQLMNLFNVTNQHDAAGVFEGLVGILDLPYMGSTKYGSINGEPVKFPVHYFYEPNESLDLMIKKVKKALESYEYDGIKFEFDYIRSSDSNKIEGCKILEFYVINPYRLSRLFWDNQEFKSKLDKMISILEGSYDTKQLIRIPDNGRLYSPKGGMVAIKYHVILPRKFDEGSKEVNRYLKDNITLAVECEVAKVASNFLIEVNIRYIDELNLDVQIYVK